MLQSLLEKVTRGLKGMEKGRFLVLLFLIMLIFASCSPAQTPTQTPSQPAEEKPAEEPPASEDTVSAELKALQKEVDSGQQTWRLDPVAVTRESVFGDSYKVISNDQVKSAIVEVRQGKKKYKVYLTKPVRQDKKGIWFVEKVEEIE